MANSYPGCIGIGFPDQGLECERCDCRDLCKRLQQDEVLRRLDALKAEIKRMRKELRQRSGY